MPLTFSKLAWFLTLDLCRARCVQPHAPHGASSEGTLMGTATTASAVSQTVSSTLDVIPSATPRIPQNSTSATGVPKGFEPGVKWQIAIQDPIDVRGGIQPADAKVIDVDLFLASKDPTLIPSLHVSRVPQPRSRNAILIPRYSAGRWCHCSLLFQRRGCPVHRLRLAGLEYRKVV